MTSPHKICLIVMTCLTVAACAETAMLDAPPPCPAPSAAGDAVLAHLAALEDSVAAGERQAALEPVGEFTPRRDVAPLWTDLARQEVHCEQIEALR